MPTPSPGPRPSPDLPGLTDVSTLRRGTSCDVLLGRQQHLERWVVAKVFRAVLDDPAAAERFRGECRMLGRIEHANVVSVHDAGILADGRPYLISERCEGTLGELVATRGALTVDRSVEIGLAVAGALASAHAGDVLHGGVTPDAVLLRPSGSVALDGFVMTVLRDHRGVAGVDRVTDHTAPETVRSGRTGPPADVFGLASTIATMLDGRPPFPSGGADARDRVARIVAGPPAPPPEVPPWLAGLLTRMLVADPAYRPSMDEVVTTLATQAPVVAHPVAAAGWAAVPDHRRGARRVPRPRPAPAGSRVRRPALWLSAATLVVLGAGAGSWLLAAGSDAVAEPSVSAAVPAAPAPGPGR